MNLKLLKVTKGQFHIMEYIVLLLQIFLKISIIDNIKSAHIFHSQNKNRKSQKVSSCFISDFKSKFN